MRRYKFSILPDLPNRFRVKLVKIFSSGPNTVNELSIFEYSEMLRDSLTRETSSLGEPRDRMRLTAA